MASDSDSKALSLLAAALQAAGSAHDFDIEAFCEIHPELARPLRAAFEDFLMLEGIAAGLDLGPRSVVGGRTGPPFGTSSGEESAGFLSAKFLEQIGSLEETARAYHYEQRELVGRGGQGDVVRAWDPSLERELAIKRTLEPISAALRSRLTLRALARFLNEARITSQLDHPGIVPVHEVGQDPDGHAYFTMRLVRGRSLREIIGLARGGDANWSLPRLVGVVRGVCDAVAYAHSKGVLHRDLKPDNVMVGAFGEVQVMDWGMARVLGEDGRWETMSEPVDEASEEPATSRDGLLTRAGDVLGTPAYMSPEQASGKIDEMGLRSDVYSLGAMLYHVLEGHAPYVGPDESAEPVVILQRVLRGPSAGHVGFSQETAPELTAVVRRAMAPDPAERYASVHALSEDLRAYLEGRVVGAHRSDWVTTLRKWSGRHRGLVRLAAAALILITFFGGATWKAVRAAEGSNRTKQARDILAVPLSKTVFPVREIDESSDVLHQRIERNRAHLAERGVVIGRERMTLPATLAGFDFQEGPALERFILEAHYEEWRAWLMLASHGANLTPEEKQQLARIREWIATHEQSPFRQRWRSAMEVRQLDDDLETARKFLDATNIENWTDPRDLEAYAELAQLSGRRKNALTACKRILELPGEDRPRTYALLSILEEDRSARARHLLKWIQSDPRDPVAWTFLGTAALRYHYQHKPAVARAAMELGEVPMTNAVNLALTLPPEQAIDILLEYIEETPSPIEGAYIHLALRAEDLDQVKRVLPHVEQGAELHPGSQELQHNLGMIYMELEEHDKAREFFVRASALRGQASWAANTNAGVEFQRAYFEGGMQDPDLRTRALGHYEAALGIQPKNPESHCNMAKILTSSEALEDWELATGHVESVQALGGDPALTVIVEAMLGSLQADSSPEVVALFERVQAVAKAIEVSD